MKTLLTLLAAAGLAAAAPAPNPGTPLVLSRSFEHRLVSAAVGDSYVIQVRLPENYDPENVRYPVLYVLDADFWFGAASDIATYLPMVKESPAMIVVGIAYGGTHDDWWQKRARDYVPKALRTPPRPEFPLAGGADRFQQFLAAELFPFIEQHYAARADDRTLVGLSFGGTFAVHTLFTRPELFQGYIILAPGLGGDKKQLFELEAAFHSQHRTLPASVFFAIGEQDNPGMVRNWQGFADQVAAHHYEGLRWTPVLFPAETHISVYPVGVTRGLKTIHAPEIAPATVDKTARVTANTAIVDLPKPFRRVVTGVNAAGKSVIVSDGPVPPEGASAAKGANGADLWLLDHVPADLAEARDPIAGYQMRQWPPAGGVLSRVATWPPGFTVQKHRSATIDFVFIISGSLELLLDEGSVTLGPGDSVVQRGTNHGWRVVGDQPCTLAAVLLAATQ